MTAYRNPMQVYELANLLSKRFEVYIHFDKKVSWKEIENCGLNSLKNTKVYSLYHVNWGGSNHLKAILYMISEALHNKEITYFHIISGEDWPISDVDEIYKFFENTDKVYMRYDTLSNKKKKDRKLYKIECSWQKYYWFVDVFDYKKLGCKLLVKGLILVQKCMGINRYMNLNMELSRGLVWGDLPRDAVEYCLDYSYRNPEFLEFLSYGLAAEEFFFQTILNNSYEWKQKHVEENLRYIVWNRKNGSYPAILDIDDLDNIEKSHAFFARKIRFPVSRELVGEINDVTR